MASGTWNTGSWGQNQWNDNANPRLTLQVLSMSAHSVRVQAQLKLM